MAFALGDDSSVYSAIFLVPSMACELAEQVRLRSDEETRHIPKVANQLTGVPSSLVERAQVLSRLMRGEGRLANVSTVAQNYLSPDEPVVVSLGNRNEPEAAAFLEITPRKGVELAGRLERAAELAERLPPGPTMHPVS